MARFIVDLRVDYSFEVEAENAEEAERVAWEYDYVGDHSAYDGVYSLDVEKIEEDNDDE